MAEAPLVVPASPRRARMDRAGRRVARSGRVDRAARPPSRESLRSGPARTMSESRRARNRELIGLVSELRCECGRPNCKATVPAVAETQRGIAERLVVTPAHFEGGVVVRAADRFFVVEPDRYALGKSQGGVR